MPRLRTLLLALSFSLLVPVVALANALVIVEVRTSAGEPADGTVVLTPRGGGEAMRCQTSAGDCRISAVPGGQYTVQFQPNGGTPTAPRPAMIPPEGRVTLHVAAP